MTLCGEGEAEDEAIAATMRAKSLSLTPGGAGGMSLDGNSGCGGGGEDFDVEERGGNNEDAPGMMSGGMPSGDGGNMPPGGG